MARKSKEILIVEESSEINVIPQILQKLALHGATVTVDTIAAQAKIIDEIEKAVLKSDSSKLSVNLRRIKAAWSLQYLISLIGLKKIELDSPACPHVPRQGTQFFGTHFLATRVLGLNGERIEPGIRLPSGGREA